MFNKENSTIGFIGLGNMGSGMTKNLQLNGFKLVVNDVRKEAAETLIAAGAVWANTPAEVAAQSDVVITMLPTPKHVDMVSMGANGILSGIKDGGYWVDMSTSVPEVTERARQVSAGRNLHILMHQSAECRLALPTAVCKSLQAEPLRSLLACFLFLRPWAIQRRFCTWARLAPAMPSSLQSTNFGSHT
jgi:hypothetical protein